LRHPVLDGHAGSLRGAESARLPAENQRLTRDLAMKGTALVVLGKTHALLELLSEGAG
jgi:hypothetical protein